MIHSVIQLVRMKSFLILLLLIASSVMLVHGMAQFAEFRPLFEAFKVFSKSLFPFNDIIYSAIA